MVYRRGQKETIMKNHFSLLLLNYLIVFIAFDVLAARLTVNLIAFDFLDVFFDTLQFLSIKLSKTIDFMSKTIELNAVFNINNKRLSSSSSNYAYARAYARVKNRYGLDKI